jgi:streptogramin lyase
MPPSIRLGTSVHADALAAGPDGTIWFGGVSHGPPPASVLGRLAPGGQLAEFPTPEQDPPTGEIGVGAITAGSDGAIWFAQTTANRIGRITTTGQFSGSWPIPGIPLGIAAGPDDNLWFTEEVADTIGRATPAGVMTEFPLAHGSRPTGIAAGPDGNLWFTEMGRDRIGRITPEGQVTEFALLGPEFSPPPAARSLDRSGTSINRSPDQITAGPDGNLWFTMRSGGIGRITTEGDIRIFNLPVGTPTNAIASGPDGNLWFATENEIGSITTGGLPGDLSCPSLRSSAGLEEGCGALEITALTQDREGSLWFATGPHCRGGGGSTCIAVNTYSRGWVGKYVPPPVRLDIGSHLNRALGRSTAINLSCLGGTAGDRCRGTVSLIDDEGRRIGRGKFALFTGRRRSVPIRLTRRAANRLFKRRTMQVLVRAVTRDGVVAVRPLDLRSHREGPTLSAVQASAFPARR